MANINRISTAYFDGFAAELTGKLGRLNHLITHSGSTGTYHEEIVRTVLRNFLSKRFSVKTGFIYKDDENVSSQIDILIVDENAPAAYVFQEGDFAVVIPEAVIAFIEVKTTLTSQEFHKALKNIASAKKLMEFPVNHAGLVFGFQSSPSLQSSLTDTRAGRWFQKAKPDDYIVGTGKFLGPDAIIWLKENYSIMRFDLEKKAIAAGLDYRSLRNPDGTTGWQLSILLAMVVGACEFAEFKRTRQFAQTQAARLLGMESMEVSDEKFVFGEGLVSIN
jgi:Domain of unknown function (DUF6602)